MEFISASLARFGAGGGEMFEMENLLLEKLEQGRLEAWGLQTFPAAGNRKERIAEHFFEHRAGISFGSDRIKKLKHEFEVVEIRRPSKLTTQQDHPQRGSKRELLPHKAGTIAPPPAKAVVIKRGGGRVSDYPRASKVLEMLYREHESYRLMPAAKIKDAFEARFRETQLAPGEMYFGISERSLRDHIKRYRQESAETGR